MPITPFNPQYMKSHLTAALQELTPRQIRDADPDRAIDDWVPSLASSEQTTYSSPLHCIPAKRMFQPKPCLIRWPNSGFERAFQSGLEPNRG